MALMHQKKRGRSERAQILLLFAMSVPVLILFVGLGIDFGFAFVAKTSLSKAVDSAALSGMRNLSSQGATVAREIALSAFNANYGTGLGRDVGAPVVSVNFTTDANNNSVVNVTATATINTYFLRLLSGFQTLSVSSSAQAVQPKLIMSLVLDKSGSMTLNGGQQALPDAVTAFLQYFNQGNDELAMISFSSIASVDVPMTTEFVNPISQAVKNLSFAGGTFSQAGLQDGLNQITSVSVPAGEDVVEVAVFFTDGWANTVQNTLNCPSSQLLNFGGCAPPESQVGWCSNPPTNIFWMNPTTGDTLSNNDCNATQFPSAQYGNEALTQLNVSNDAEYRAVQVANAMRAQNITVYSIGLGDKISEPFLDQIANDSNSTTFDPSQPQGEAVFAPDSTQLKAVFTTIAQDVLLRLSK